MLIKYTNEATKITAAPNSISSLFDIISFLREIYFLLSSISLFLYILLVLFILFVLLFFLVLLNLLTICNHSQSYSIIITAYKFLYIIPHYFVFVKFKSDLILYLNYNNIFCKVFSLYIRRYISLFSNFFNFSNIFRLFSAVYNTIF